MKSVPVNHPRDLEMELNEIITNPLHNCPENVYFYFIEVSLLENYKLTFPVPDLRCKIINERTSKSVVRQ